MPEPWGAGKGLWPATERPAIATTSRHADVTPDSRMELRDANRSETVDRKESLQQDGRRQKGAREDIGPEAEGPCTDRLDRVLAVQVGVVELTCCQD